MGKKRSKTAKKKQAKVKTKNNGKGKASSDMSSSVVLKNGLSGVMVTKGSLSKNQQGRKMLPSVPTSSSAKRHTRSSNAQADSMSVETQSQRNHASKNKSRNAFHKSSFAKPKQTDRSEMDDFQREQLSLHERVLAQQQKQKRRPSPKQKQPKKTKLQFTSQSFSLQKTTNQVLDETTAQIQHLQGVGALGRGTSQGMQLQSVLWMQQNDGNEKEAQASASNAFAALQADSDDDDDDGWDLNDATAAAIAKTAKKQEQPALFQFAPSSFNFTSALQTQQPAVAAAEDDPDL